MTESQFVEEVYGSGVLVYLSATWLSELYQQVLACSLLETAGYNPNSGQQYALINLLQGNVRKYHTNNVKCIFLPFRRCRWIELQPIAFRLAKVRTRPLFSFRTYCRNRSWHQTGQTRPYLLLGIHDRRLERSFGRDSVGYLQYRRQGFHSWFTASKKGETHAIQKEDTRQLGDFQLGGAAQGTLSCGFDKIYQVVCRLRV